MKTFDLSLFKVSKNWQMPKEWISGAIDPLSGLGPFWESNERSWTLKKMQIAKKIHFLHAIFTLY